MLVIFSTLIKRLECRQQLKRDEQFFKEMGGDVDDISVPSPFTVPNRTGMQIKLVIRDGMRNQGEGSAVAPVIINNDVVAEVIVPIHKLIMKLLLPKMVCLSVQFQTFYRFASLLK